MTAYNVTGAATLVGGQPEDVSQVLANLNLIAGVINGNLDNANISAIAGIVLSKLAGTGIIGAGPVTLAVAGKTAVQIADSGAQLSGLTIGGDTNLYRSGAGVIATDGALYVGTEIIARKNGATQVQLGFMGGLASIQFGSATDTNLYRTIAGNLESDGTFAVHQNQGATIKTGFGFSAAGASGGNTYSSIFYDTVNNRVVIGSLTGGTSWRHILVGSNSQVDVNQINFGTSDASFDINLYRASAGNLKTDTTFTAGGNVISGGLIQTVNGGIAQSFSTQVAGDTFQRMMIDTNGQHNWGTGALTWDTNLYRSAVGTLKTDGVFNAVGGLQVGGVPAGMVRICDLVLGASQPSFDTTTILGGNIPQTYSHLMLKLYLRGDAAVTNQPVWIRLNNDASAIYDYESSQSSIAANSASETFAATQWAAANCTGSTAAASLFSPSTIDILHYTNAVGNKTMTSKWGMKIGTASGNVFTGASEGNYRSNLACTRIQVLPGSGGNFVAGSRFTLYGLP